jgi:anti-sigma factor RsiW
MAHNPYEMMISLSLDGLLDEAEQQELNLHLTSCPACTDLQTRMNHIDVMFKQPAMVTPPVNFSAGVMARIDTYETSRRWTPWLIGVLAVVSVIAALSVATPILVVTLGLWRALLALPVVGTVLAAGLEAWAFLQSSASLVLEMIGDWLVFMTNDPVALGVVLSALIVASTSIGLLEGSKAMRAASAAELA